MLHQLRGNNFFNNNRMTYKYKHSFINSLKSYLFEISSCYICIVTNQDLFLFSRITGTRNIPSWCVKETYEAVKGRIRFGTRCQIEWISQSTRSRGFTQRIFPRLARTPSYTWSVFSIDCCTRWVFYRNHDVYKKRLFISIYLLQTSF